MKKKLLCLSLSMALTFQLADCGVGIYAEDKAEIISNENVLKDVLLNNNRSFSVEDTDFEMGNKYTSKLALINEIENAIKSGSGAYLISDGGPDGVLDEDDIIQSEIKKAYEKGVLITAPAGKYALSDYAFAVGKISEDSHNDELKIKPEIVVDDNVEYAANICNNIIKSKKNVVSSEELLTFVKTSIINTADIVVDEESGIPYSVRKQGGGIVDEEAALNNEVTVTYNGKATVELGEVTKKGDDILVELKVSNYGKNVVEYTVDETPLYFGDEEISKLDGGIIKSLKESVSIPAGESVDVPVLITIPEVTDDSYIEGFIKLKGESDLSIPVLMYAGDYGKNTVIDMDNSYLVDAYGNRLGLYTKKSGDEFVDLYNEDYVYTSPDSIYGSINILADKKIGMRECKVCINDGNEDIFTTSYNYLDSGISTIGNMNPFSFATSIYDKHTGEYKVLEDGKYSVDLYARHMMDNDYQKNSFKINVDSIAPVVNTEIEAVDDETFLVIEANDNVRIHPYFSICVDGKVYKKNLISDCTNNKGKYYLPIDESVKTVEILLMDVAGNAVYTVSKTGDYEIMPYEEDVDLLSISLKSGQYLSSLDVDEDGKVKISGKIKGKKPDSFKISGKEVEYDEVDEESEDDILNYHAYVDVKSGVNSFKVVVKDSDETLYDFTIKNVIYNGQGANVSVKKGLRNAAGIIKTPQKAYNFNISVKSDIGVYNVYVNDKLMIENRDYDTEGEKSFDLTYNLDDEDTNFVDVKVVDLCGNVSHDTFKLGYKKIVKAVIQATSINNATVGYEKVFTYTGKEICPDVIVVCNGLTLIKDEEYSVRYENNVEIGMGKLIIEGLGYYTGTIIYEFKIKPKKTDFKSITLKPDKKGRVKIKVKKRSGGVRYQITYSRKKTTGFTSLKKTAKTSFKTNKLLPGKTYYLKVRCYKVVNGVRYNGAYSAIKKVKIKKIKVKKSKKKKK